MQRCDVAFDTSDCWNFPKTMQVIGIESVVTQARFRYTRGHLAPCICSLIKPAANEMFMPFPSEIHRVRL